MRHREQQPTFVPPMLLASGPVPGGDRWALELKWDGCGRSFATTSDRSRYHPPRPRVRWAVSRARGDRPPLGRRRATLDGELVCLRSDGQPDFARLRYRLTGSLSNRHPALLQVFFYVLHLDGRSTRPLPYSERRALLEELALDGPARRTPASVVVDRREDFVARVEELGLEGVVAKRLSSTCIPGRRCTAWVKHKLRRQERFAVTRVRRTSDGFADAVFVARHRSDGSLMSAGSIELGLGRELIGRLQERLAQLAPRRRGSISWYPAEVSAIASVHGLPDGAVRDEILRDVVEA